MKFKFQHLGMMIALMIVINSFYSFAVDETNNYKIGNYVIFGQYNNEPILWQVINLDDNGNPLLVSAYVLDYKVYDSIHKSTFFEGSTNYMSSIYWDECDLRKWLNYKGDDFNWTTFKLSHEDGDHYQFQNSISYSNTEPITINSYKESGFLSSNNFTENELSAILTTENDFFLSDSRIIENKGGSEVFYGNFDTYDREATKLFNYEDAYFTTCQDKVFLLSLKEINEFMIDRGLQIGGLEKNTESHSLPAFSEGNDLYWLRTAIASHVNGDGIPIDTIEYLMLEYTWASDSIYLKKPYDDTYGVRPALYLDAKKAPVYKGSGDSEDPIIVAWTDSSILNTIRKECYLRLNNKISKSYLHLDDHIIFGKYNNTPIDWEVIGFNEYGNPLLLSKDIITIKSYDSRGNEYSNEYRKENGSSNWEFSNIRQWLNSEKKIISWINNEPSEKNLGIYGDPYGNGSPYNDESGFLYKDNFTDFEKSLITTYAHIDFLSEFDKAYSVDKKTGIPKSVYEEFYFSNLTDYYYKYITDKMFLLSTNEVKKYLYDRDIDPRAQLPYSVWKGSWHDYNNIKYNPEDYYNYVTRTASNDDKIYTISGLKLSETDPSSADHIRPAFYLNLNNLIFSQGYGSADNPFIIESELFDPNSSN